MKELTDAQLSGIILVSALVVCFIGLTIVLIDKYRLWVGWQKREKRVTSMKVKDLKNIYRINPEAIGIGNVKFFELHYELDERETISYIVRPKKVYIYLSFWGYLWLRLQVNMENGRSKRIKKYKEKKLEAENMREILNSCQKRIDVLHDEAARQIEIVKQVTEEVKKNMYQW